MQTTENLGLNLQGAEDFADIEKLNENLEKLDSEVWNKMDKNNPTGTGAFSMNRKVGTEVGDYSFAEGINCEASGRHSHAEGYDTTASGDCSHSEGNGTTASGDYGSHAEGGTTTASGDYAHAEGGDTTASGDNSHAEGQATTASGDYGSHAEGSFTTASGKWGAHAEGQQTTASGDYAHAEGFYTLASGDYGAHAEGQSTTASGDNAHAEGSNNVASGSSSHAGGYSSTAYNSCSFVNGYNVESPSHDSMTIGHHTGTYPNDAWAGSAGVHQGATDAPAFVIGAGTENAGGCCFIVDYKGNTRTSTTGALGGDYAEYFEWLDGNPHAEDRVGHFVTLDGEKIKYANAGDYILGIVSGMPAILGNNDVYSWTKKYVTDEFNRRLDFEQTYTDEEGNEHTYTGWKVSDEYNPEQQYQSRKERKEWDAIGMLGVLSVYDDGTCQVNGFCDVANGGIATAGSTYRVIARVSENIVKVIFR